MLSDYSDLTDLSPSDDDFDKSTTKTKKSTTRKRKKDEYRLRNVLKPGRTTQYTAKALYDQIHQNDIELDPDYQRDVVWSDAKQIGLIDSIFRNFYVPPIIFSVTTEDDGTEKRVCIDGKQRLTSIQKFIGGQIPHRDPFTNEKLWFLDSTTGPKRKLLPPHYKTLFQNKQIVCIEYSDLPGDLEREVFQRVQMGMALTPAEKLQAVSGPWPDFIREIMQQYLTGPDGIANSMDLEKARARDFQNIALALFSIDHLPDYSYGTPLQLERWIQQDKGPSSATRAKIHNVFQIYQDLANDEQLKAPFEEPSRVAPAEFIMAAVLIAVHKGTHSLSQLSQAIGIMRSKTRAEHVDIRTNSKVYKTMFSVITKDVGLSTLKNTPGQGPASRKSKDKTSLQISKTSKRKRDGSSNEDSSEDNGDDNSEYKPRTKKRNALGLVSTSHIPKGITSTPLFLPEDQETKPIVVASPSNPNFLPSAPTGLEKIRAAKLQVSELLGGTQSGPSHPNSSISYTSVNSAAPPQHPLPTKPSSSSSASLEAMMMSQASNARHPPQPYPTPPLHTAPQTGYNGVHASSSNSIPIPANGKDYLQHSPNASRNHPVNDGYRRHDAPHSTREETNDGGYRGRGGYGTYRERERDNEGQSHPRGSYSNRPGPYYKSRDVGWERRGSGYKDR